MPLAPAVAAALTDHSAHPWSLFVNGNDLIGATGSGNVLLSSVTLDLKPAGQVSGMSFETTDIAMAQSIVPGMYVMLYEWAFDRPRFTGYVSRPARQRLGMGNTWTVECVGIEIVLDWAFLTADVAFSGGEQLGNCVQALCAAASWPQGFAPRAFMDTTVPNGNQAFPVSPMKAGLGAGNLIHSATFTAGTSLRSALRTLITNQFASTTVNSAYGPVKGAAVVPYVSVDWWNGIRAWVFFRDGVNSYLSQIPGDFANVAINDTYAGPNRASSLVHQSDGTSLVRTLILTAPTGPGAGTVWVNDGSGYAGPARWIHLDTGLSVGTTYLPTAISDAAQYYFPVLADGSTYGDFTLEDYTPVAGGFQFIPGCVLTITDTQAGLSAAPYQMTSATVTFNGPSGEDWAIHYGRTLSPSYVDAA